MNAPSLPAYARQPFNRCNLPASLLGGLTFQDHPAPLLIDGVLELHNPLFVTLAGIPDPMDRARLFQDHMRASFCLDDPEAAGLDPANGKPSRHKLDYLRLLRGWLFDADSREGAVLKGWVESRFGLLARNHRGPLGDYSDNLYAFYLSQRVDGLYNTNALEAQLDLLYTYCQFETGRHFAGRTHLDLYRGVNRLAEYETLQEGNGAPRVLLLNNLNSFTDDMERAGEFGDQVIGTRVPLSKLVYFPGLLPGLLQGEREYLVIGGLYAVEKIEVV